MLSNPLYLFSFGGCFKYCSKRIVKIACDRLECKCTLVVPVVLATVPCSIKLKFFLFIIYLDNYIFYEL